MAPPSSDPTIVDGWVISSAMYTAAKKEPAPSKAVPTTPMTPTAPPTACSDPVWLVTPAPSSPPTNRPITPAHNARTRPVQLVSNASPVAHGWRRSPLQNHWPGLENCCGIPVADGRPTPVVLESVVTTGTEVAARSACGARAVLCGDATPADRAGEVRDRVRVVLAAGIGVAAFVARVGDGVVLAAFLVVVGVVRAALFVEALFGGGAALFVRDLFCGGTTAD
jgi:hypothetical protein